MQYTVAATVKHGMTSLSLWIFTAIYVAVWFRGIFSRLLAHSGECSVLILHNGDLILLLLTTTNSIYTIRNEISMLQVLATNM